MAYCRERLYYGWSNVFIAGTDSPDKFSDERINPRLPSHQSRILSMRDVAYLVFHELAESGRSPRSDGYSRGVGRRFHKRPCELRMEWPDKVWYLLEQHRQSQETKVISTMTKNDMNSLTLRF